MAPDLLPQDAVDRIRSHLEGSRMTLAVLRTSGSPQELRPLFGQLSSACGLSLVRVISSPLSDFGFAEFNSNARMLVVLFIGGPGTELVSVSETDEVTVREMEDSVSSSNIQSSIIRDGL